MAKARGTVSALYPHQEMAVDAVHAWRSAQPRSGLTGYLSMPTGSGKTRTAVTALKPLLAKRQSVLWVAHSRYLLDQAHETFVTVLGRGIAPKIGSVAGPVKQTDRLVTLATIQTLTSRDLETLRALVEENRPALVVFDEFHRVAADTWKKAVTFLRSNKVPMLGLSATPTRTAKEKRAWLERQFPNRLFAVGIMELIGAKVLAKPSVHRVAVSARGPKWTAAERAYWRDFRDVPKSVLKRLGEQEQRNRLVVQTYKARGAQIKQALVFCCTIDHAEHLAERFAKAGVSAASVTGKASDTTNEEKLNAFRKGKTRVLTSVVMLTEGIDLPTCDTVMLARPTQSEILLKQMVGRAMRGPQSGGGETCTIVDFVDAFAGMNEDLSGTSLGFMREFDHEFARILQRKPTAKERSSLDLATLLRLRDWFAREAIGDDSPLPPLEGIHGVFEFWDQRAGLARAVLVPESERGPFISALREVETRLLQLPQARRTQALANAAVARDAYAAEFPKEDAHVSEEDFVAVVAEAVQSGAQRLVKPRDFEAIARSLRRVPVVQSMPGIGRLLTLLSGND